MAEPLTPEEEAALRSLPRGGTPFEINGAIERDGLDFELSDATRYDRRILLVSLRSALAALATPAPLDEAWAEAEAALPEGAYIWLEGPYRGPQPIASGFHAWAFVAEVSDGTIGAAKRIADARGDTHVAALRALAARLKGDSDGG